MHFKKIIIGLDLTETDITILNYVRFLTLHFHIGEVYFFHNIKTHELPENLNDLLEHKQLSLEKIVQDALTKSINKVFPEANLSTHLLLKSSESTSFTLVQVAASINADLIILGKKNDFKGKGIQANKTLRMVKTPVLLVPTDAPQRLITVAAAIDFSEKSKAMLNTIAQKFTAPQNILPIHVFQLPRYYFPYIPENKAEKELLNNAQKEYQKLAKSLPDTLQNCHFLAGKETGIAGTIQQYINRPETDINLLVLGLKATNRVNGQIGSTTLHFLSLPSRIPICIIP